MRRFLTLVSLLCLALPAGISVTGCYRNPAAKYCAITSGYGMKVDQVASIILQPQTTGISLSFGQTRQISTPTAYTCTGDSASVSNWTYGTTDNKLVDISPTGMICAGTWNRNSGGGIADYTICNKPTVLPSTNGLPYSVAHITASANSVTSNAVAVYVHAQATSVELAGEAKCYSQTSTALLDSQACYSGSDNKQYLLCAPATLSASNYACPMATGVSSVPSCASVLGAFTYALGTSTVGSINSDTNVITALQPGTTNITATIAGTASSAGYFSVCPPSYITLKTPAGGTSATVTQGTTQTLTTIAEDTHDQNLTGLSLSYQSTNPIDITVANGTVATTHPGVATIYATCQPPACNPSPLNELGLYGTGLPVSSNPVTITTPGTTNNYVWFGAPNKSQYFVPIDLLTSTEGSTVKLPYVPNSMVMDKNGSALYFGSSQELMIYSTASNSITTQNTAVPGKVLAVSPDNSYAIINDQSRSLFYLYNISSSTSQTFNGMGAAAAWTPDSKTLYIVDSSSLNTGKVTGHTDTLYVYNTNLGWSSYDISSTGGAWTVASMIPGLGAYMSGSKTQARAWCPAGTVGNTPAMTLYPQADLLALQNDTLTATTDGAHILGATQTTGGITLNDLYVQIPSHTVDSVQVPTTCVPSATSTAPASGAALSANTFTSTPSQTSLTGLNSTAVNQLVTSPVSGGLTFLTYSANSSNTGASLPFYQPSSTAGAIGSVGYVTLNGSASISAPIAGAFSPDNSLFFLSTAGDNKIHFISIPSSVSTSNPPTDSKQITPGLPTCSSSTDSGCTATDSDGTVVPATVITVVPRATT